MENELYTAVLKYMNTNKTEVDTQIKKAVEKHNISRVLSITREDLFNTIRNFYPDYDIKANVIMFENNDISKMCSVSTRINNIAKNIANLTFTIKLMVPMLWNEDISYAKSEEAFWELLDVLYHKADFDFYNVGELSNAVALEHESGKGTIYQVDITGTISLLINDCEEKEEEELITGNVNF